MPEKKHTVKNFFKKIKQIIVGRNNIVATLIITLVVLAGIITAYFCCDDIVRSRGMDQFDDAMNTVVDQINSKFQRDGEVLASLAEIVSGSDAFLSAEPDKDKLRATLFELKPLQQSMRLRILLPDDTVILPDDSMSVVDTHRFKFAEEAREEHISGRLNSRIDEYADIQIIAHFVPIEREGQIVAMLYGVTPLFRLPSTLRIDNVYNSNASVLIFDVKSEGKETIMDTWHVANRDPVTGEPVYDSSYVLQSLYDYGFRQTDGKPSAEIQKDILNLQKGYSRIKSQSTGEWLYFYYSPAGGAVKDQWEICIVVSEEAAFGSVGQVRTVFIVVGVLYAAALAAYFFFVRYNSGKAVQQQVERALLEEKLHKAEAAERAKTLFLSNMSHDIRTPMNAILGYTALAETNIDNKERVQDYLKKILSSGNHLLSLINDILDMSRIESGKLNIEEKECTISDIFRDMRNIIQTQMKSKQLNFYMDTLDVIDENIYCDKLHVNQVLLNLLSNAIKFTPAGGSVSLTVRQKAGAPQGYGAYEIRVKDTGIGMSPEFAVHIFEPFERERTSTVSGIQGTGLGMAITKSIVDAMGGDIRVETQKDKGTEFIINLRFRLQQGDARPAAIQELKGLRALVVDDSFDTCDSVCKMLVRIGMRPEWSLHGKEAVLRAQQAVELGDEFAVYIIDWVLPDLSGFEVVRQIRKTVGEGVPIIIITAYDVSAIIEEARGIGVTAYCNKPIFLSELRDTLVSAIERGNKPAEESVIATDEEIRAFTGKRILLVEDNELNREIAEELLVESGFGVDTAENGQVAVDKVSGSAENPYDLVLMDIQMPVMDGYEATKAIRSLGDEKLASVPIVAMTANAFAEDREKAKQCGMNAHIAKPIDIPQLLAALKSLLL